MSTKNDAEHGHTVLDVSAVRGVLGCDPQIVYRDCRTSEFGILGHCIQKSHLDLDPDSILAIICGWAEECMDRMASRGSIYSGYDGHDNIKEGYRTIVKAVMASYKENMATELREDLYTELLKEPYFFSKTSWLAICDVGVGFVDVGRSVPMVLSWREFNNVHIEEECILFECENGRRCFCGFFPQSQYRGLEIRTRIVLGISRLKELFVSLKTPEVK